MMFMSLQILPLLFAVFPLLVQCLPSQLLAPRANVETLVNLRIEGASSTIYEGPIVTKGHNVTTASGGTHECNGLNNNENPSAGPTCTSALADAAQLKHFSFDGTFDTQFDDFFITSIDHDAETATQFWGLLLNFQFTPVGGCQQEVKHGDEILWAFDAFNANAFLKLSGPSVVKKGSSHVFTVTDGTTGSPIAGATVGGQTTDANGHATIVFTSFGLKSFKAEKASSIRSNKIEVIVA